MESFNKVLYFILGLVVVLVFIIVFTGRLNLGKTFRPLAGTTPTPTPKVTDQKGFLSFFGAGKATPTPTPKAGATPTPTVQMNQQAGNQQMTSKGGTVTKVQTIQATGSPAHILFLAIPTLLSGFALRRKK